MTEYRTQNSESRIQQAVSNSLLYIQLKSNRHKASQIRQHANEKGIALSIVLILSAIALAIMAGLIYMLTSGTQISGAQKRYKTALEAGIGGSEILYQVISERIDNPVDIQARFGSFFATPISTPTSEVCLNRKLLSSTSGWVGACTANASTMSIDPADNTTYDMSFQIGAGPTYTAYAKIVDTVVGNSGADLGLTKGVLIPTGTSEITLQSRPYLYTIEVDTHNTANPSERARLSVLYEY